MEKISKDTKRKICNRFEKSFKEDGFCWSDFNKSLDDAIKIGRQKAISDCIKEIDNTDFEKKVNENYRRKSVAEIKNELKAKLQAMQEKQ